MHNYLLNISICTYILLFQMISKKKGSKKEELTLNGSNKIIFSTGINWSFQRCC